MLGMWKRILRQPLDDVLACLEPLFMARKPLLVMIPLMVSAVVVWVVYVPIHEILHAYGCIWSGGSVTELQISGRYLGALFAKYFPFVVTHSEYAGRLSGFDTHGSDLCYMATVFLPFMLSVLIGIPLIKAIRGRRRPILFGAAVVIGLAPFYNLTGDYNEMGTIIVTRAATLGTSNPPVFAGLRPYSDDIFNLWYLLFADPAKLGLKSFGRMALAGVVMILAFMVGLVLSFLTYWLGHLFACALHIRGNAAAATTKKT